MFLTVGVDVLDPAFAPVAERIVREILTGVAVQATARETEIASGRPSMVVPSPLAPS